MSVEAILELEQNHLLWPQSTTARIKLTNDGSETLSRINPANVKGAATVILINTENGETTRHATLRQPDLDQPPRSLEPGKTLEEIAFLSRLFQFPACGVFEVRAHYEWMYDETESEPDMVQVLPARPQAHSLATTRGTSSGNAYCAWVNDGEDGYSLWLSEISTAWEARFSSSKKVAELTAGCLPVLSVPANRVPTKQYIAWIVDDRLQWVVANEEASDIKTLTLGSTAYEIVAPVLEDPYGEGLSRDAEVLLFAKRENGWELRVALLGDNAQLANESQVVQGPHPPWLKTVYRSDSERITFFLVPRTADDGLHYVSLGTTSWSARQSPASLTFLHHWQGELIAADVALTGDDRVIGAVLIGRAGEEQEIVVNKWFIGREKDFSAAQQPPLSVSDFKAELARIKVNARGDTFCLFRDADGTWRWIDENGLMVPLSLRIDPPADIFFVNDVYPAILFTDQSCGLRLHYLGPELVYRPPRGAS